MPQASEFRSIVEAAQDGMLIADAAGKILQANLQVEQMFGYAPGDLIGCDIGQLVPINLRSMHAKMVRRFMAEGIDGPMGSGPGIAGQRKDGSIFPIAVMLNILTPVGGQGKCVSVSVRAV